MIIQGYELTEEPTDGFTSDFSQSNTDIKSELKGLTISKVL